MEAYYLPELIVCNTWMRNGYSSFADGDEVEDRNGGVHIGGNEFFYDANIDSYINLNSFDSEV